MKQSYLGIHRALQLINSIQVTKRIDDDINGVFLVLKKSRISFSEADLVSRDQPEWLKYNSIVYSNSVFPCQWSLLYFTC